MAGFATFFGTPACLPIYPVVTRNLLIANIVVFALQYLLHDSTTFALTQHFALWPWGPDVSGALGDGQVVTVGFQPWQLVTYAFMHGGFQHIFFNMFALYMFGGTIERTFGTRNFIIYYFVCAIVAALAQLIVVQWFHPRLLSHGRCLRCDLRCPACLRHVVSARKNDADLFAYAHAGLVVRHRLCGDRAVSWA
jgi:membrane associated rhomboid family serine protease